MLENCKKVKTFKKITVVRFFTRLLKQLCMCLKRGCANFYGGCGFPLCSFLSTSSNTSHLTFVGLIDHDTARRGNIDQN